MNKNQAIRQINEAVGFKQLNVQNTHWSNIVEYGANEGWWLNIPFHKFSQDLNLILKNENLKVFLHIRISANSVPRPNALFRDKSGTADIFMPHNGSDRLIDCQSRGSRHDFTQYPAKEYEYQFGVAR